MATQIWRFPVHVSRDFFLPLPVGAQFLSLVMKGREPMLYYRVDTEAETGERVLFVVPTGINLRPEEEAATYRGSFTVDEGGEVLVFHVLEEQV